MDKEKSYNLNIEKSISTELVEEKIEPTTISIDNAQSRKGKDVVDASANDFSSKRNVAEGMMDIALLTANANQLRLVIKLNTSSISFFVCMALIIFSLILQIIIGFILIYKVSIFFSRKYIILSFYFSVMLSIQNPKLNEE